MSSEPNRFYIDPDTQDRIPATYRVHLVIPALHDGFVDVEATSEDEAAQLAIDKHFSEIEWEYDGGDKHAIEVFEVECDEPSRNGILVEQGYYQSNANIDSLFVDRGKGYEQISNAL
jgi:hypothetical protein